MHACVHVSFLCVYVGMYTYIHTCVRHLWNIVLFRAGETLHTVKLIAFELAGEDRERRKNPVVSRLKIAFYVLHKRG